MKKLFNSALKEQLKKKVYGEITYLLGHKLYPTIHDDIDAVWVFSGPGTFFKQLDTGEPKWMAWMDRYRILYGIALVRKITAKRLSKKVAEVTVGDIGKHGPLFLYNGTPEENHSLRKALKSQYLSLPEEKVFITDQVIEEDGTKHPIRNTRDQIKSFPRKLLRPPGPIQKRLAIISHAAHIPRILRYLESLNPFLTQYVLRFFR